MIVAFHFQFSNQTGWKCDACRRSGLEKRRRCGWENITERGNAAPVWARKGIALMECPKSYITPESVTLVEEFFARRRFGGIEFDKLSARQADAFTILENEFASENDDGQKQSRYASRRL